MAENSSKVLVASYVRIVNMDSKTDDRVFESSVQVLCGYDPQGVNVKLIKGRLKWKVLFYCLFAVFKNRHEFLLECFVVWIF